MFSGKVVLITGSNSGIGAGTALHFTKLGAFVAITGRNVQRLNKVAKECEEIGKSKPFAIAGDLADDSFVETLISSTIKHFKKLDILVNNAGFGVQGGIEITSLKDFEAVMKVNMHSIFYLTKLAMPYLVETKGNVVNISSLGGMTVIASALAYSVSKAALDQFTRCLALEMGSKGVRVNGINPGAVYTDIFIKGGATKAESDNYFQAFKETAPLKRVGTVEDIARAIAFFASEENARCITGVNLPLDAGQHVVCGPLSEANLDLSKM